MHQLPWDLFRNVDHVCLHLCQQWWSWMSGFLGLCLCNQPELFRPQHTCRQGCQLDAIDFRAIGSSGQGMAFCTASSTALGLGENSHRVCDWKLVFYSQSHTLLAAFRCMSIALQGAEEADFVPAHPLGTWQGGLRNVTCSSWMCVNTGIYRGHKNSMWWNGKDWNCLI